MKELIHMVDTYLLEFGCCLATYIGKDWYIWNYNPLLTEIKQNLNTWM